MKKLRSYLISLFKNKYKTILKIRKCPFCDSKNLYLMEYHALQTMYIKCCTCSGHGFPGDNAMKAIENWNKAASQ